MFIFEFSCPNPVSRRWPTLLRLADVTSALEAFLNDKSYVNLRFTYLLTYHIVVLAVVA